MSAAKLLMTMTFAAGDFRAESPHGGMRPNFLGMTAAGRFQVQYLRIAGASSEVLGMTAAFDGNSRKM